MSSGYVFHTILCGMGELVLYTRLVTPLKEMITVAPLLVTVTGVGYCRGGLLYRLLHRGLKP